MSERRKQNGIAGGKAPAKKRAVAYYRYSTETGRENSVEVQQGNVRAFAAKHGIEIIHEFVERGKGKI